MSSGHPLKSLVLWCILHWLPTSLAHSLTPLSGLPVITSKIKSSHTNYLPLNLLTREPKHTASVPVCSTPSPYLSPLPSSVQASTVLPSCSGHWHCHQLTWAARSFPGSPHNRLVPPVPALSALCSFLRTEQIGQWHSDAARFGRNNTVAKAKGLVLGLSITTLVSSVK